jgi:hypothetical protein
MNTVRNSKKGLDGLPFLKEFVSSSCIFIGFGIDCLVSIQSLMNKLANYLLYLSFVVIFGFESNAYIRISSTYLVNRGNKHEKYNKTQ